MGYEVAVPDALGDFYLYRRPLPHDLKFWRAVRHWLGPEGIVYCGHNTLFWIPLLRMLGLVQPRVVSLLFAREPLDFARAHSGVVALTPAAADQARRLAPRARVAHLAWGADMSCFPELGYEGGWFLSCGLTNRDYRTLSAAADRCSCRVRVAGRPQVPGLNWPSKVELIPGGNAPYGTWLREHYTHAAAVLIVLKEDGQERTANGFTNLIEAMGMGRPVIVTRTGALPGEIDVEQAGCGLHVPPGDPVALADAMQVLARDPDGARQMGERGRELARRRYSIGRYAGDLHRFFESL
jgi:hypothetical protein